MAHFKKTSRDGGHENLLFLPNEENNRECFLLVVGLSYPNMGETFFQLLFNEGFPEKPPGFRCLTECGVYEVGPRICISIGEYHDTDRLDSSHGAWGYLKGLGVLGFGREIMNGIVSPDSLNVVKHRDSGRGGIGIKDSSVKETAMLALQSSTYNAKRNSELRQKFLEYAQRKPELKAAGAWMRQLARESIIQMPKADCPTLDRFNEGFGDEIQNWIESTFPYLCPHVEGALHLNCARTLAFFVPHYTKPFIAYVVLSVSGNMVTRADSDSALALKQAASSAWDVFEECVPGLHALKELLAKDDFLTDKHSMTVVLAYLWFSFNTMFTERDDLVVRLREAGKATLDVVNGWRLNLPL